MGNITKTFTYSVPNEPGVSDFSDNLQVNASYIGEQELYVFIDTETKKLTNRTPLPKDLGDDINPPFNCEKILVDANVDPIVASIVYPERFTITDDVSTVTVNTIGDHVYEYEWPSTVHNALDIYETTYDENTNTWTYVHHLEENDWEGIKRERDALLDSSDAKVAPDMPEELRNQWIAYRQALRDLPTTWDGVEAWKVVFPTAPNEGN